MAVENIQADPRSKVTPRSSLVFAHLHSPPNGPTKHQLPTLYSFQKHKQDFIGHVHHSKVKG